MQQSELLKRSIKISAKTISIILHPLLMPTLVIFLFFQPPSYLSYIQPDVQHLFYIFYILATFLIPLTAIPLMVSLRFVSSLEMPNHKERRIPLLFSALVYAITHFLFYRLPFTVPSIIQFLPVAGAVTLVIASIVSNYWKISLHMTGIGGAVGAMAALSFIYMSNVLPHMILLIVLSGILGTARLLNRAHKPAQIYAGFFLGFFVVFAVLFITT